MNFYEAEKVNDDITVIRSKSRELLYLIQGEKEAVLIDAGLLVGNLKELLSNLTNLPFKVLLTHGHVDHAPGAALFEEVFLNKKDLELYRRHCIRRERLGYLQAVLSKEECSITENMPKEDPDKVFHELKEGMVFDLGGIHIEAFEFPGHTRGSVIFLIQEYGILILGDACNNATFLFDEDSGTVEEYLNLLKRLEGLLKGRYERVFFSHHVMEADREILGNMIVLCQEILEGKADDVPFTFMGRKAYIAKKCNERFERDDNKSGNLIYSKEKVR